VSKKTKAKPSPKKAAAQAQPSPAIASARLTYTCLSGKINWESTVRISAEELLDDDQKTPLMSRFKPDEMTIWISPTATDKERFWCLVDLANQMHGNAIAITYKEAMPLSPGMLRARWRIAFAEVTRQLNAQGGIEALSALQPT
jgi:hypothetical protein